WWVRPDRAVRSIIASGQAIVTEDAADAPAVEKRLPSVSRLADRTLLLAYLARPRNHSLWDLWIAPITVNRQGGTTRGVESARRRLAERCVAITPTFSPDGRWVFAALNDPVDRTRVRRFEVGNSANEACTPPDGGTKPGGSAQRSRRGRR